LWSMRTQMCRTVWCSKFLRLLPTTSTLIFKHEIKKKTERYRNWCYVSLRLLATNLLPVTNWLTNSMEQIPSWEACSTTAYNITIICDEGEQTFLSLVP
jgi:hypothetical protein